MKFRSNWHIYSTSLSQLVFFLLHSNLFEKDSKLYYSNYRPNSLLSNIENILEKLMQKRLYTFLNKNIVIYNLQFGFRQQYCTSHALINITENIRKALDNGNISCAVL